jgi:hypothetical protein
VEKTVETWVEQVDRARGDRELLEALLVDAMADGRSEARSVSFRIRRYLHNLSSREPAGDAATGGREISPELTERAVNGLEHCEEFLVDETTISSLLIAAADRKYGRATEILLALRASNAHSARNLLFRLGAVQAPSPVPLAVREWLWAYAIANADREAEEVLCKWGWPLPRHLLDRVSSQESAQEQTRGWVYLLREDGASPCIVKVGMTMKPVHERVRELNSSTSQHRKLVHISSWAVPHPRAAERDVHSALNPYRICARREFFQIEVMDAIRQIGRVLSPGPSN